MNMKLGTFEASLVSLDKVSATWLRCEKEVLLLDIHEVAIVFSLFCTHCTNATTRNALSFQFMSSFSEEEILLT